MNPLIFRKLLVAVTGLFLSLFLVVHLSANLLLLLPEHTARETYNAYAAFLRGNPLVSAVACLLYASILAHVGFALALTVTNRRARQVGYAMSAPAANSTWVSRNMGALGTGVLLFMIVHLANFWARVKLGLGDPVGVDAAGNADLYAIAAALFRSPLYVAFYSLLMIPLGLHLWHGLSSAFRTMGLHSVRGARWVSAASLYVAFLLSAGFAIVPLFLFLR